MWWNRPKPPDKPDKPIDRRRFFREGLRELMKPLATVVEPLEEAARQLGALEGPAVRPLPSGAVASGTPRPAPPIPETPPAAWLRPPGALPEQDFLDTCSRCGECVKVCPARCIKIEPPHHKGENAPFIEPDVMPCVLCDGLLCMHSCPTGALLPTPLAYIKMGTAVWDEGLCVRTHGEPCTDCIDHCPVGSAALVLREEKVHVIESGCTGCGVCQHQCPTDPKSIVVVPRAAGRA